MADATSETPPIDDLIRKTLNAENLRLEEAEVTELKIVLDPIGSSVRSISSKMQSNQMANDAHAVSGYDRRTLGLRITSGCY
jgi:hypothetical protein